MIAKSSAPHPCESSSYLIASGVLYTILNFWGVFSIVGIFLMLHTFGPDLKRNVHIHLSVTLGGLTLDLKQWKNTSFKYDAMMKMWRTRIIQMLRNEFLAGNLTLPPQFKHLNTYQ